jgi:hypothetical protein
MRKYVLVGALINPYDGNIENIERIYSGSEKECLLYKDIIVKEVDVIRQQRMREASWYVHTFGIDYFKDINPFKSSPNINDSVCGISFNLLNGYNKHNLDFTPRHKYDGWELHIV